MYVVSPLAFRNGQWKIFLCTYSIFPLFCHLLLGTNETFVSSNASRVSSFHPFFIFSLQVTHLIYSSLEAINFACCKKGLGRNMCCTSYAFYGFVFIIAPFQFFMWLRGVVRRQKQRFHEFFFLWPFYASSSVQRRSLFFTKEQTQYLHQFSLLL